MSPRLLDTMLHLKTAILNAIPAQSHKEKAEPSTIDPMLLVVNSGCHPTMVEMGILGMTLTNTIVDGGSGVNVLPKETWKKLGKPTLWPPTFNLLGADQQGIKPLETLMAQQMMIGTQPFLLDFVVIPLNGKGTMPSLNGDG